MKFLIGTSHQEKFIILYDQFVYPDHGREHLIKEKEVCINRAELIKDAPIYKGIPGAILKANEKELIVKQKIHLFD